MTFNERIAWERKQQADISSKCRAADQRMGAEAGGVVVSMAVVQASVDWEARLEAAEAKVRLYETALHDQADWDCEKPADLDMEAYAEIMAARKILKLAGITDTPARKADRVRAKYDAQIADLAAQRDAALLALDAGEMK